jgi:hypothetical protein
MGLNRFLPRLTSVLRNTRMYYFEEDSITETGADSTARFVQPKLPFDLIINPVKVNIIALFTLDMVFTNLSNFSETYETIQNGLR